MVDSEHRDRQPIFVHAVSDLRRYYGAIDVLQLTGPGEQDTPYTLEYAYPLRAKIPSIAMTWGWVQVEERTYRLPEVLKQQQEHLYEAFPSRIAHRLDHTARCPRVSKFSVNQGHTPLFEIQFANYADQVGTNMYPDEPLVVPVEFQRRTATTVREWDQLISGSAGRLPSLESSALANTIGVAVGITVTSRSGVTVLWRRRSDRVRMYPGMAHVPLSFALNLENRVWIGRLPVKELLSTDLTVERSEELGIEHYYSSPPRPMAFCRDLPRAGKPQFFFELEAMVDEDELRSMAGASPEYRGKLESMDLSDPPPANSSPELLAFLALKRRELAVDAAGGTGLL